MSATITPYAREPQITGTAMPPTGRILVAEDDAALRELLVEVLNDVGHVVTAVNNGLDATLRLKKESGFTDDFDVVLTDLVMPGLGGEAVLACALEFAPNVPVIVSTAFGSVESAVRTVRTGAFDYVTKPVGTAQLLQAIERAILHKRHTFAAAVASSVAASHAVRASARTVGQHDKSPAKVFAGLVAESASMRALLKVTERVAPSPHPVLLTGESGAGKEVMAHAIHALSGRSPFIVVNCGAIPEQMIEAELFGQERGMLNGSVSGAESTSNSDGHGLLAAAHGGTLFLDEVAELPLSLQPAMLRFLESGVVRRLGAQVEQRYDVRVIAATNRDLEGEMTAGRFREDLYWRLNVLPLELAPLRERIDDILPLAHKFLQESNTVRTLDASTESLLTTYSWPGNVRELRTAMHRASTFCTGTVVMPHDLPPRIREANRAAALVAFASQQLLPLRAVERAYVLDIVSRADGNKSRAAEILGLDRKTLYRKLSEYAQEQEPVDDGELL